MLMAGRLFEVLRMDGIEALDIKDFEYYYKGSFWIYMENLWSETVVLVALFRVSVSANRIS